MVCTQQRKMYVVSYHAALSAENESKKKQKIDKSDGTYVFTFLNSFIHSFIHSFFFFSLDGSDAEEDERVLGYSEGDETYEQLIGDRLAIENRIQLARKSDSVIQIDLVKFCQHLFHVLKRAHIGEEENIRSLFDTTINSQLTLEKSLTEDVKEMPFADLVDFLFSSLSVLVRGQLNPTLFKSMDSFIRSEALPKAIELAKSERDGIQFQVYNLLSSQLWKQKDATATYGSDSGTFALFVHVHMFFPHIHFPGMCQPSL